MLKRAAAAAIAASIALVIWRASTRAHVDVDVDVDVDEPTTTEVESANESGNESESESGNESERESESETERGQPVPSGESPEAHLAAIRQDVHLLEIQRRDAEQRGDHETEARLDREIAAARAEHDRLRGTGTPEGI